MKCVALAGFAALALGGLAAAADQTPSFSSYVKAPVYNLYSWAGFYAGVNGGAGLGRSTWDSAGVFNVSGGLVGGTIGYNWQVGQMVFGVEDDVDWSGIKGSTGSLSNFCAAGCSANTKWLTTVRGRIGYAFDRIMPFVSGGLAAGDIRDTSPGFGNPTQTHVGWTAGAGVEFAIGGNWTAKGEYLHVDSSLTSGATAADNVSYRADIFRGGINYRF